jgi:TrwC relaxase
MTTHPHLRCTAADVAPEVRLKVALPVKVLKAGQEAYWLDQIARNREEYFSGRGESPGRFVGRAAATAGLEGIATAEQVRAMFQGLDPATGEVRCAPLKRPAMAYAHALLLQRLAWQV